MFSVGSIGAIGRGVSRRRLWTPLDLGSLLALWLDPKDATSIFLNGSTISQWSDKSGNGNHAVQPLAAAQPTYALNGLNGRPVITFPGTDNGFILTNSVGLPRHMASVSQGVGFLYSSSTANTRIAFPNASVLFWSTATNSPAGASIPGRNSSSAFIEEFKAQGNTYEVFLNGASVLSGVVQSDWTDNNRINQIGLKWASGTAVSSWNGIMGEIVWTNNVMSSTNEQRLQGYLAWGAGLQGSLPAGHPYRSDPPTV